VRTGIGLCDFGEAIVEVFMSLEEGSESKELRVELLVSSSPLCDFDSSLKFENFDRDWFLDFG